MNASEELLNSLTDAWAPGTTVVHGSAIIPRMTRVPLAADTSLEVEDRQIEAWRRMTPTEKGALITSLTQATFDMALAGIRQRFPDASPREQFLRLAILNLGPDLAAKAYPEIDALGLR